MSDEGRVIAGRYRLQQQIGSGAMGVVWRAVDERLSRTVAVKQLLLQPGYTPEETEEARQRSMREGRIAARLQHQNAIVIFDVAEDEGQPVLVMEYLPSRSLATVLTDQGLLAPQTVARIGAQVAGALAAAHMAGIVHRDLKPGNVLLGDNGDAKITDFGISRAIGDVSVTKSGILAGTPAYLSPEVALGRDPAPASDVFSLGSTLYAAIEGEPPFGVDENAISLLHRVARGEVTPPRQSGPMTAALMRMLEPDPVDRPTMAQTREILQAVADGRPIPPPASNTRRQPPPPVAAPQQSPTRVGHPAAAQVGPPTQAAEAVSLNGDPRRRSRQTVLLWTMALLIAILAGILVATALSSGQPNNAQGQNPPPPTDSSAPQPTSPAATTSAAASSTAPTSTSATTSTTSSETETTPSSDDILEMAEEYYSLVPDDLDEAWEMLGPSQQEQGKEAYERFWNQIEDVEITEGPKVSGTNVTMKLKYTKDDGSTSTEYHSYKTVVSDDGEPLIDERFD